ncbi:MAG: hypothetical protein NVSMB18_36480 [Acetobacteraceae bacterium]
MSFRTAEQAKAARWHSRRHETRECQDASRERYHAAHGPKARRRKAAERRTARP